MRTLYWILSWSLRVYNLLSDFTPLPSASKNPTDTGSQGEDSRFPEYNAHISELFEETISSAQEEEKIKINVHLHEWYMKKLIISRVVCSGHAHTLLVTST